MRITIAGSEYKSLDAARQKARSILASHSPGETICDIDDHKFLLGLLGRHPGRETKVGVGVLSFQVELTACGAPGFWITRLDESHTDFSFLKCLKPPNRRQDVLAAMRAAILPQILSFRDDIFAATEEVQCPITGATLTKITCHVDHEPPFSNLVASFLEESQLSVDTIELTSSIDGAVGRRISDPNLLSKWRGWHLAHATLRILQPVANIARGKARRM